MNKDKFIQEVCLMRNLQKEYFRCFNKAVLKQAKIQEKIVDDMIAGVEEEPDEGQVELFSEALK